MTRCRECFNLEQFCTCHKAWDALEAKKAERTRAWVETVQNNARKDSPLLPIDTRWQRIAVAAFN